MAGAEDSATAFLRSIWQLLCYQVVVGSDAEVKEVLL